MWLYRIKETLIYHLGEGQLVPVGRGYSGLGDMRNDPKCCDVKNWGPIPLGAYKIEPAHDDAHLGKNVMRLTPWVNCNPERSGFMIHADNATHTASHGCIILNPTIREAIAKSEDRMLIVLP